MQHDLHRRDQPRHHGCPHARPAESIGLAGRNAGASEQHCGAGQDAVAAIVAFLRKPAGPALHRDLMWYATDDDAVLGVVILDLVDKDYSWVVR